MATDAEIDVTTFGLLPADAPGPSAQELLDAAVDSVLEDDLALEAEDEVTVPFGRTVAFNWETGRFQKRGGTAGALGGLYPAEDLYPDEDLYPEGGTPVSTGRPIWVTGTETLKQWIQMALHSARFAHSVFSDSFGMELPDSILGTVDVASGDAVADWSERMTEALLVHERILGVEDFSARFDEAAGIMYIDNFTVVTDDEDIEIDLITVDVGSL